MTNRTDILTPVGRIVQGDLFNGSDKGYQGKQLTDKNNNPRMEWYVGLAIPKTAPEWAELWAKINATAAAGFPGGQAQRPDFSWKVVDGDAPEHAGKEGLAGHWLLRMSSGFAPKVYTPGGANLIVDPNAVKRGDYVRVYGSVAANGDLQKPGVYINVNLVEFVGHGEPIVSGPSGTEIFGGTPAGALPAGASATPVAPATPLAQGPGAPAAAAPMVGGPATTFPNPPAAAAPAPGGPAVAPAPDFLGTAPAAPAAPTGPVMLPAANGVTYEAYVAAGWSDEQLRAAGMMQ